MKTLTYRTADNTIQLVLDKDFCEVYLNKEKIAVYEVSFLFDLLSGHSQEMIKSSNHGVVRRGLQLELADENALVMAEKSEKLVKGE